MNNNNNNIFLNPNIKNTLQNDFQEEEEEEQKQHQIITIEDQSKSPNKFPNMKLNLDSIKNSQENVQQKYQQPQGLKEKFKNLPQNSDSSDEYDQEMITKKQNHHGSLKKITQTGSYGKSKIQQSINMTLTKDDQHNIAQAPKSKYKHLDQIINIKQTLTNDQEIAQNLMKDLKICKKKDSQLYSIQTQLANKFISISQIENVPYLKTQLEFTGWGLNKINEKSLKYKELIITQIEPSLKGYSAEVQSLKKSLKGYEKLNKIKEDRQMLKEKKAQQEQEKLEKANKKKKENKDNPDNTIKNSAQTSNAGKLTLNNKSQFVSNMTNQTNKKNEFENDQEKREQQKINNEIRLSGVNLATNLRLYILNRNSEFKAIMNHIVNKQMGYHSYALAQLLKVTQGVLQLNKGANAINQKLINEMIPNFQHYEYLLQKEKERKDQKTSSSQQQMDSDSY